MKSIMILFIWFWTLLTPVYADSTPPYEIIGKFNEGPGNLTVTPDGRIIMSLHQFYNPQYSVVEVLPDRSLAPFPNKEINERTGGPGLRLDSVLGIHSDSDGVVWMLDNGMRSGVTPKLVAWDTRANKLHRVIDLPASAAPRNAFVNDLAVDKLHNRIFISDPAGGSNAALIVVNLETGRARRVLEGDKSVIPEKIDLIIDTRPLRVKDSAGNLVRPHIGINPIAEDSNNEWVYFGAMHGRSFYRVRAEDLANEGLKAEELASRVERYSSKPISDGIAMDTAGNIYLGDLAANAIGRVTPGRKYQRLAQSPDLSWVDSLSVGPDGHLYALVNRLHLSAMLNGGDAVSKPPYFLIRIKLQQQN